MLPEIIKFIRTNDYRLIKSIGQGGTGYTVLLEDDIIKEQFVCKKYSPYYKSHQQVFFDNFKNEIKILYQINHPNIVRIFNYHLYPQYYTGYILMEFIKGQDIYKYISQNPEKLNDIFLQVIEGFTHLESKGILHRDIRPDNILVSDDGIVKIIDFGFGKIISSDNNFSKSISLNWRYSIPKEFEIKKYDFCTEIYFIGKLFEEIILDNDLKNFGYFELLKEMVLDNENRINSFFDIQRKIISNSVNIYFEDKEKSTYLTFANHISHDLYSKLYIENFEYITDIDLIIRNLESAYESSMLETFIQNNTLIARCFVKGEYSYYVRNDIKVETVKHFIDFLKTCSKDKQKVILNNLWQRLDNIKRVNKYIEDGDDLPF